MILQFFRWHRISKNLQLMDTIQRWLVLMYGLQVRTQSFALGTAAMYLNGSWLPNEVKDGRP